VSCSFFQSGSDNFIAFIDDCFYTIMVFCSRLREPHYIFTVYCISEIPSVLARGKTLIFLKIIIILLEQFFRSVVVVVRGGGNSMGSI
jgi:hypothetical protein